MLGNPPRLLCQCDGCNNPIIKGQVYCHYHKNIKHCTLLSPVSGSEPVYNPDQYNNDKAIQHSHNCFAYAMGIMDISKIKKCREKGDCAFHSPGKKTGHPGFSGTLGKTCSDVISRTMADVGIESYVIDLMTPCKKGWSKIAVVVDKNKDFHYYLQNLDGSWSHKPGAREVTNKDAVGALIVNPQRASRYYPKENSSDTGLNYSDFCSFMCVPRTHPIVLMGGWSLLK